MTTKLDGRQPLRLGVLICLALIAGLWGWGAHTRIEGAIVARGEVDFRLQNHSLRHPQGGRIVRVHVSEGQQVVAGQPIAEFDSRSLADEADRLAHRLERIEAQRQRFEAERADLPMRLAPDAGPAFADEHRLFLIRQDARDEARARARAELQRIELERRGLALQVQTLNTELRLVQESLQRQQSLLEQGFAAPAQVEESSREVARLDAALAALMAGQDDVSARGALAQLDLQAITTRQRLEAEEALAQLALNREDLALRAADLRAAIDDMILRAPVTGVVHRLMVLAPGGLVAPGAEIAQIAERQREPVLVVRLRPDEAAQIHPGQPARVHVPAWRGQVRGDLQAVVSMVAPVPASESGTAPQVRVELRLAAASLPRGNELHPGLGIEAYLTTGERRVLDLLLGPLRDPLGRALAQAAAGRRRCRGLSRRRQTWFSALPCPGGPHDRDCRIPPCRAGPCPAGRPRPRRQLCALGDQR